MHRKLSQHQVPITNPIRIPGAVTPPKNKPSPQRSPEPSPPSPREPRRIIPNEYGTQSLVLGEEEEPFFPMAGYVGPAHEGYNWITSSVPPVPSTPMNRSSALLSSSPAPVTDGYGDLREVIIRNAVLACHQNFQKEAAAHQQANGNRPGYQPLNHTSFFRTALYTVPNVVQPDGRRGTAWRAMLYWLQSASDGPRLKLLAKSSNHHGSSAKLALRGLLEATAAQIWHVHNVDLQHLESGEGGFFGPSRGTSVPEIVRSRQPTTMMMGSVGSVPRQNVESLNIDRVEAGIYSPPQEVHAEDIGGSAAGADAGKARRKPRKLEIRPNAKEKLGRGMAI